MRVHESCGLGRAPGGLCYADGMARARVPHSSHWGAFEAEVADGTVVAIHPYRARSRSLAAARQHRRWPEAPRPDHAADGPSRLARPGPRPRRAARRRAVRAGELDNGERPARARAAAHLRPVRGRGRLRRLVRLEQRRPLPPRAEPAPPVPQLPRRLRARRAYLQQRRAVGDHAARRRIGARVPGPRDGVVGARAAHGALRLLRRHPDQEHDGEPGRRQPAPRARPPPRGAGPRRRVRAAEPAARRSARVRRRRMASARAGQRRRRHARARVHARRRGAGRPRVPRALLRRASTASSAIWSARTTAVRRRRNGPSASPGFPPRRSARSPGGWPRSGRSST